MSSFNQINELRRVLHIPDSIQIVNATPKAANKTSFAIPSGNLQDNPLGSSALNTFVYSNIEFLAGSYEDERGRTINYPALKYDAVIISVSQAKKIVKTEVAGYDGTVKEYIGKGDYEVSVSGIIPGTNGSYPLADVIDLKKMLDAPVAIDVACRFLQNLDIVSLVVEDYEIPQQEGGYSYQTFTIRFISETPHELRLS